MRIIVERNALFAALTRTAGVVGRRSTIEILKHVRIETKATHIELCVTNLDIQATINVPARIETAGSTTVAAERLREICARLPEGAEIVIDATDPLRAQIKAGRSKFSIGALPSRDFPLLTEPEGGAVLEMAAGAMLRLLTIGASCMGEATRNLNRCLLQTVNGKVRAVSTDSRILSYCEAPTPEGFEMLKGVSISTETVAVLIKALGSMKVDDAAMLTVLSGKMLSAELGGMSVVSRVIDGDYPLYERVIPAKSDSALRVDTDILSAMLRRAKIAADYVDIALSGGRIEIRARDQTTGDSCEEEAECDWSGGERLIPINASYMLELLANVGTEDVTIQSDGPGDPLLISETRDSDWVAVCMPAHGGK